VTDKFAANPDVPGEYSGTIALQAERSGTGEGRTYTIDVTALDSSGNQTTTSCVIVVPHNQRKND
jgi:hypothetical protein